MRLPLLVLFGVASVGCSATVATSPEAADAEAAGPATAVVIVERTSGPGDGTRAEAVARFVQMRSGSVDEAALRMVGAAVDFPAIGACAAVGRTRERDRGEVHARAVKLADVGAVTLEANGVRTSLVARQLPDVADLVSGVVYTARGESGLAPRVRYALSGAGMADVEAFDVVATAPAEPSDVRVAGQDAKSEVALIPGAAVDITWEASASSEDAMYVDIAPRDASSAVVRCSFADNGRATLPSSVLATVDEGTMSLHRLHRESFRARGLDGGEIRFDFARAVAFTRR